MADDIETELAALTPSDPEDIDTELSVALGPTDPEVFFRLGQLSEGKGLVETLQGVWVNPLRDPEQVAVYRAAFPEPRVPVAEGLKLSPEEYKAQEALLMAELRENVIKPTHRPAPTYGGDPYALQQIVWMPLTFRPDGEPDPSMEMIHGLGLRNQAGRRVNFEIREAPLMAVTSYLIAAVKDLPDWVSIVALTSEPYDVPVEGQGLPYTERRIKFLVGYTRTEYPETTPPEWARSIIAEYAAKQAASREHMRRMRVDPRSDQT